MDLKIQYIKMSVLSDWCIYLMKVFQNPSQDFFSRDEFILKLNGCEKNSLQS